jgi:hypothetical protein
MSTSRLCLAVVAALIAGAALAEDVAPQAPKMPMHDQMHGPGGVGKGGAIPGEMKGPPSATAPAAPDGRQVIELTAEERDFVLAEMRGFLDSVQGILQGVVDGDMKSVSAAALKSGMGTMQHAPRTLMTKMPMEFKMLGMDTHQKFGALADEATGIGDKQQVLKQLTVLLANCNACHQGYRLTTK